MRATLVLALSIVLAACSSSTAPASDGDSGSGGGEAVTVKFNILGYSPNTPKLYQKAIDDFEAANPGIKVQLSNGSWDSAHDQFLSWINTGDTPDITVLGPKWLPELIELGGLQPFDDYLTPGFIDDFPASLTDPLKFDGKIYSVPEALSTRMMYYRKDLFDKAGVTSVPKTWDEMTAALQAVNAPPDVYGMAIQGGGDETVWYYTYFMFGAGGDFVDSSGKWAINQPANVEGLQYEVDLVNKYKVSPPDTVTVDQDTLKALFTTGKAAVYWGPPWTLPSIDKSIYDSVQIANYPTKSGNPAPLYIQDSFALFKAAKHPKEAVKFLEFWSQAKYQVDFNVTESLIPVTNSAGSDPAFADNVRLQEFVKAIPLAKSYPLKVGWETVNVELRTAVQAALLGQKTPQQALDDAQAAIDAKVK